MTARATFRDGSHYEKTWPHPKPKVDDSVDPRLVAVVRRALRDPVDPARLPDHVAERVWAWLAEGD